MQVNAQYMHMTNIHKKSEYNTLQKINTNEYDQEKHSEGKNGLEGTLKAQHIHKLKTKEDTS